MEIHYPGVRSPVQEQRARWERKRACTAQELLETERRYQEQLGLVTTYFLGILKAKGTLRPPELQALFGSWELICGASQELLPYLEGGCWGQGLEGFCRHLELYNQFAANSERSQTTLQEQLKKNKGFRRFVRLQESRPEFGGLQLQDLLPLPLQRLQQYENLVIALAENTGPNSPDHQQLTRRWFLRQGWLLVVPPHGEPRPRMFFLFTDVLLMAKPRPPLHLLQSGTFACKALYPMAQCQLSRVFGHSGGPCGGLLSLHGNSKGFSFSLDLSEPCAKRWSLSSCPSLMRSYCLCPQTRRSCHAGTTV
ncbi:PREDICTED: rho guanine nucleotide exchange factor 39 isoform X5 [Rhinopithecus bieti]|uniref:rho guanine nucleotide exchange factor 39 isoform X5 n=1 Tax=Rhinopithecus bieti TaxID=61621 RepID=UPI00083C08CC|nr:PREDICTED: rho guanine nucleotide exchange factor 39 isoform X5 [Rhinopithecus bieti]